MHILLEHGGLVYEYTLQVFETSVLFAKHNIWFDQNF